MLTLFGIPSCDQVEKSKQWLNEHNVNFKFYDFKKQGITTNRLTTWCNIRSCEVLPNKRGIMWEQLSKRQHTNITQSKAIDLMCQYPTLIKCPAIEFKKLKLALINNVLTNYSYKSCLRH